MQEISQNNVERCENMIAVMLKNEKGCWCFDCTNGRLIENVDYSSLIHKQSVFEGECSK